MAMLLSDHATPDGNHFSAYGCHTFKWVNANGESVFVKVSRLPSMTLPCPAPPRGTLTPPAAPFDQPFHPSPPSLPNGLLPFIRLLAPFISLKLNIAPSQHSTGADRQYHFRPHHGAKQLDFQQTLETQGIDPDYSKRQMFETIAGGGDYKWTMMIQVMTAEQATKTAFDPFDVTKVWPRSTSLSAPPPRHPRRPLHAGITLANNVQASSRCKRSARSA